MKSTSTCPELLNRASSRWLLLVGIGGTLLLAIWVPWEIAIPKYVGESYTGSIGTDGAEHCWIRASDGKLEGSWASLDRSIRHLNAERSATNDFTFHQSPFGDSPVIRASIERGSNLRLQADPSSTTSDDRWEARLPKVADLHRVSRTSGLRIADYGCDCRHEATFSVLKENSPLEIAVNRSLREMAGEFIRQESPVAWSDIRFGIRNQDVMTRWSSSLWLDVVHTTSKLVAIREYSFDYRGGTRGYESVRGYNFVLQNGQLKDLQLSDLFSPSVKWQEPLAQLVRDELIRQGASDLAETDDNNVRRLTEHGQRFSIDEIGSFLVLPTGLQFIFLPYASECTDGRGYEFYIPSSVLKDSLGCTISLHAKRLSKSPPDPNNPSPS